MGPFFSIARSKNRPFGAGGVRCALTLAWILSIQALFFAASLHAQVRIQQDEWNRGYEGFAAFCRRMGLQTVSQAEWLATPPEQSVLVALGDFREFPRGIQSYVRQGGAVLVATDRGQYGGRNVPGVRLWSGPVEAADENAAVQGFRDCPVVSKFEDHPLTRHVLGIATNRPGWFHHDPGDGMAGEPWKVLARLPRLHVEIFGAGSTAIAGPPFLAALETESGGRAAVVADQSVFANQMLLFEENLSFMVNVVTWLGEGRTTMLLLDDRAAVSPPLPEDVELDIPPPSPEEVREALRQLPPDVLVPFANSVIAGVEDTGIPDELIAYLVQRIPPLHYRRLLLTIATCCLGLVAFRKLIHESVAEKAASDEDQPPGEAGRRQRARLERQNAARELLERFRSDVAETSAVPWPVVVSRLRLKGRRLQTWLLRFRLRRASRRLAPGSFRYWTRRRLRQLNARVNDWRRLRAAGELEYKTL